MTPEKFFHALENGTNTNQLKWNVLSQQYYNKVTNIWSGIVDGYYTGYKSNIIVVYQYKAIDEYHSEAEISYFISVCDASFNYKYEFTQSEIKAFGSRIFNFYKSIQRSANNINSFMEEFINDYSPDDE